MSSILFGFPYLIMMVYGVLIVLVIYVLILLIKALKIYINKNS